MYQYYIIEIRRYQNGEYEHQVHFAFDSDPTVARLKADSKYYEVLATAAVSDCLSHAATLISAEGQPIMSKCYSHGATNDVNEE